MGRRRADRRSRAEGIQSSRARSRDFAMARRGRQHRRRRHRRTPPQGNVAGRRNVAAELSLRVSERKTLSTVVPAHARTHNHRIVSSGTAAAPARTNKMLLWSWVPAFAGTAGKELGLMVRDGAARLLTMRVGLCA